MAIPPETIEEWCHVVPHLFSDESWETLCETSSEAMSFSSCPWGGGLVRFRFCDFVVQDPPADPSCVLVRPESRAEILRNDPTLSMRSGEYFEIQEVLAPGTATAQWLTSWKLFRLCEVFFGSDGFNQSFYPDPRNPITVKQRIRRNFPQQGDACVTNSTCQDFGRSVVLCRPQEDGKFTVFFVFDVAQCSMLLPWADGHFAQLLKAARDRALWFINRPGIQEMRSVDQQFCVVLTMQSFRRGRPLIPEIIDTGATTGKQVTTIDAGKTMGLTSWTRYHPRLAGSRQFRLADYLRVFLDRTGERVNIYDTLDGQELLPYQCTISRKDWSRVSDRFRKAYALQKAAYRHANGGPTAPGICEDVAPRFRQDSSLFSLKCRTEVAQLAGADKEPRILVRNTFVEVEYDEEVEPLKLLKGQRSASVKDMRVLVA